LTPLSQAWAGNQTVSGPGSAPIALPQFYKRNVQEWPSNPRILPINAPVAFPGSRLTAETRNRGRRNCL